MTKGLQIRLSEGAESSARPQQLNLAPAASLTDAEAQNVLKRLEPIKSTSEDEKDFQIRDRSLPPPRTGKTVETAFPPPETVTAGDTKPVGPLEVLRYSPEGDVPLAPHLSVTFSQPMVAVTSHADTTAAGVLQEPLGPPDVLPKGLRCLIVNETMGIAVRCNLVTSARNRLHEIRMSLAHPPKNEEGAPYAELIE